jgi:hypothetical protein
VAREQLHAELLLEQPDLAAQRRLRDGHLLVAALRLVHALTLWA